MNEHREPPVAGRDYPQTWNQFTDWFHDEDACLDYLERLRWPQQFICPKCGVIGAPFKTSRNRLVCQASGHQASVTAGTIFDKTRTPLKVWLAAAWYITNQNQASVPWACNVFLDLEAIRQLGPCCIAFVTR